MEKKLISFIMFSRNLNVVKGFLDNIEATVKNPDVVELMLKLDEDQPEAKQFIEEEVAKRQFTIKYVITPRLNGLTSLWLTCNELFLMSSPDSYFVQSISDEVRFETQHWDEILQKYIGYFPDHVFRLRMSTFKLNNNVMPFTCNVTPDSFPIYSRKWLTLTLGFGSCCWASDVYHQFVAYHMGLGDQGYRYAATPFYDQGVFRDVPLLDIKFSGLEFGIGVSPEMMKNRELWMIKVWNRNMSHHRQEYFSYLAKRVSSYIWAVKQGIQQFELRQSSVNKSVQVIDETGVVRREVSYQLPRLTYFFINLARKFRFTYVRSKWWLEPRVAPLRNKLLCHANRILNKCLPYKTAFLLDLCVRLAFPASLKAVFKQLAAIDRQIPVAKIGRLQKNTKLFFMTTRALIQYVLDKTAAFLIGPPPALPAEKKFLGLFRQPGWPKSLVKTPEKDMEWALALYKSQQERYRAMESAVQSCDMLHCDTNEIDQEFGSTG